ncbi:ABC transporter substrate-binding protein [Kibdelosporangium phytohabitans]|uniref:Glycine/betaine ABC transporter substrate-binding protein n=1 Tax=Kibdelosporangium phytohabitans TaxID=860235 RepID=A0A0N7F588_9PSEU|nr:ABC transporter substrate-binding protein [Kibdelosporangium phytohabitans]ALG13551.1 glycine/betaine ABC transporter substrate-binding protein [Kibdelosporangium phytohabitans]MBE1465411.1 osmoprotectant transport system substrate-binding protein [Kibdelosporangium phytohabitans]
MKRTLAGLATAVAAALMLTACGGSSDPLASNNNATGQPAPTDTIIVGSANFAESRLLAEIYAQALAAKGVKVDKKLGIGSRETYYPGLQDGSIDLVPEYTGTLLTYLDKKAAATSPDDVYDALKKTLPQTLAVLDKAAAEDKDAVVVTKETAEKYKAKSIADLAPHMGEITFGGPPEFQQRVQGIPGLKEKYGLTFKDYKSLEPGPITTKALKDGNIQAADIFTTDAAIPANGFVVLEDPKNLFAAQNVIPVVNAKKASDLVKTTLNKVSSKLDTKTLLELNGKLASPDKPDASKVAQEWLASAGI